MLNDLPEGWYSDEELRLLSAVAAARAKSPAAFVEIGVLRGRSATVLGTFTDRLILVDDLSMGDYRDEWPAHEAEYLTAREAASYVDEVSLLHQDASHALLPVLEHLRLFLPKIIKGGVVCLHDFFSSTYPGVRAAWTAATRGQKENWERTGYAGTLVVFERKD